MRSVKEQIGADYDDRIAFYLVGTAPYEDIEQLEADRAKKGLSWPVAYPDSDMLATLNISSQASKIAIGQDGTITHRYRVGRGDHDSWRDLFEDIAAN